MYANIKNFIVFFSMLMMVGITKGECLDLQEEEDKGIIKKSHKKRSSKKARGEEEFYLLHLNGPSNIEEFLPRSECLSQPLCLTLEDVGIRELQALHTYFKDDEKKEDRKIKMLHSLEISLPGLDRSSLFLDSEGALVLAEILSEASHIVSFCIEEHPIGYDGVRALIESLSDKKNLKFLKITYVNGMEGLDSEKEEEVLEREVRDAFSRFLKGSSLTTLDLSSALPAHFVENMGPHFATLSSLKYLGLSSNFINGEIASTFLKALSKKGKLTIDLSMNNIEEADAEKLKKQYKGVNINFDDQDLDEEKDEDEDEDEDLDEY